MPADTPEITQLDAATIERIAAGEVVERPASAVKELLENSLDADANRITVEIDGDGTERICVRDDGIGMSESAVTKAIQAHTTSKIGDIDDLEAGIGTLGFRGEALHTIGAVSTLTIQTRPRGGESGTECVVEGGERTHVGPAGCPEGTTITVEDLFFNTPARKKYLGEPATEFAHSNRIVARYALANPDVAITLEHDGRETFSTPGRGNLEEAVLSVYGREVASAMVEVDVEASELRGSPLTRVWGLVSNPETTRSTRAYLSTFVNGRYVTDSVLREAVLAGYGNQLAADRFPFTVLFIELPGDSVDVNVHPRKMELRFGEEAGVRQAVTEAVSETLLEEGLIRRSAPRGRSAPSDVDIEPDAPASPESPTPEPDSEPGLEDATDSRPQESTTEDQPASSESQSARASKQETATDSAAQQPAPASSTSEQSPNTAANATEKQTQESKPARETAVDGARQTGNPDLSQQPPSGQTETTDTTASDSETGYDREPTFTPKTENATLTDQPPETEDDQFDRLPSMDVLGQFQETYVLATTDDGLILIDQHAADERINYERLREAATGRSDSQALVSPVELELTAQEAAAFEGGLDALRDVGFDAELADDGRTAVVTAVPSVFASVLEPDLLRDVLGEFVATDGASSIVDSAADELIADMSCYPSVTANTSLAEGSVLELLRELDACSNPYACPHGRPVVVEVGSDEIADRFERDYPGHQIRRPEE